MNQFKIINLSTPTLATDAATKAYVDANSGGGGSTNQSLAQIASANPSTSSITMSGQRVTNVGAASLNTDAISMGQADEKYLLQSVTLDQIEFPTATLNMNQQIIRNLATPLLSTDAVTKQYAENLISNAQSSIPVGTIIAWFSDLIPDGWLLCNGQAFSSIQYPDLFAILGGVTNVPDFRGYFLRARNSGTTGLDPNRALKSTQISQNLAHQHTGITDGAQHQHSYTRYASLLSNVPQTGLNDSVWQGISQQNTGNNLHSHSFTTDQSGGTEARPHNIAVNYIIRAVITGSSQISGYNIPAIENWNFSNLYKPINVIDPTNLQDCVTLNFLQNNYTTTTNIAANYATTTALNLKANSADVYTKTDVYTKSEANTLLAGKYNTTTALNAITAPTSNVSLNNFRIINLATPTSNSDAATKLYVDQAVAAGGGGSGSGSQITDGVSTLYFSQESLRLKQISQPLHLFEFDAPTNKMTIFPLNFDYFSNSTFKYLFRESPNGHQRRTPLYIGDSDFFIDQNQFGYSSLLYLGSNHSFTNSLLINDLNKNVVIKAKTIDITGNITGTFFISDFNKLQIDDIPSIQIQTSTINIGPVINSTDCLFNVATPTGVSSDIAARFEGRIRATGYDQIAVISHRKYKQQIQLPDFTGLSEVKMVEYQFNSDIMEDERMKQAVPKGIQIGFIVEDVPDRYHLPTMFGDDLKTIDQTKLQNHLLSFLLEERRAMQSQLKSLEQRLAALEARV